MESKKVLILTHKLAHNYGGIMQAYALQEYLRQLGVVPTSTHFQDSFPPLWRLLRFGKYTLRRILHVIKPSISNLPSDMSLYIGKHTKQFVDRYIKTRRNKDLPLAKIDKEYDALITGSDQVWRIIYVPVEKYLFDFAENQNITRLSYAASFGRDDLTEYGAGRLQRSAELAKKLNAISVREDTGVDLVKEHWGMNAEHHVDPVMLLSKDHYVDLVKRSESKMDNSNGDLFVYVLDRSGDKGEIIDKVGASLELKDFEILPPTAPSRKELLENSDKYQLPPVEQWLKSFIDAEFVITDSFHGTAFSIIFNKPFIAVGNRKRGLARFSSLLKMFNLEDRLVLDASQVTDKLVRKKIDWSNVNKKLEMERKRSHDYLATNLNLEL